MVGTLFGSLFAFLVLVMIGLIVAFWLWIWLPATMAARRQRSALGWVILTFFVSPLITLPVLVILGPAPDVAGTGLQEDWR